MSAIQVGFGRAEITPKHSVPMTGYGNEAHRYSQNVLDPLYATCLAFTDEEGNTALLYALDLLCCWNQMREMAAADLGFPVECVNLSANHTHGGPLTNIERGFAETEAYVFGELREGLAQAGKQALADRKNAQMYITDTHTERMNFVRRYLMEDGTYSGPGFGNANQPIVRHETEADNRMQLVKFVREGGKDIIIANFQVHQTMTGGGGKYDISADSSGAMRVKMERELDCYFAYFTGACGNVTPGSRIEGEARFSNDLYKEHGQTLADYAIAVNDTYRPVKTGKVQCKRLVQEFEVDHSLDYLKDIAGEIRTKWKETGDRAMCHELCKQAGLHSVYHAESVIDKLVLGKTLSLDLNVVSLGDVAFAVVPYEMYDTNGVQVKTESPFEMTVVATCSNEYRSYIPSAMAFGHGGYSVDRCRFVPGTGERAADKFVTMLKELHQNN